MEHIQEKLTGTFSTLTRFLKSAISSLVKRENCRKAEPTWTWSLPTRFSPNFSRV